MKRLKLTFAALAVLIAIGGAVATHASNTNARISTGDPLYWYDQSGAYVSDGAETVEARQLTTDCVGSDNPCEDGYDNTKLLHSGIPQDGIDPMKVGQFSDQIEQN